MDMLTNISIQGFKSIKKLDNFNLQSTNILIGANGAGKSNLLSFFKLLNWMTRGNLQFYIAQTGGANNLLLDGASTTPQIQAHLTFKTPTGVNEYIFRLFYAAPDTLIFADEQFRYTPDVAPSARNWIQLGSGHREANIISRAEQGDKTARFILTLLKQCVIYQFHNTSETARIRQRWSRQDNLWLKEDGANLAPFLFRLYETNPKYYTRIISTIRMIAPYFQDFVFDPLGETLLLQWSERGTDMIFGPHQASDGTIRVIALVALLLRPESELPSVIILDEPELGLHPYAINIIAGLLRSISIHTQVILATQSMTLIDYFDPGQIVVVERLDRSSTFHRLSEEKLKDWLEEYSIAELWEKNVIGGRPA